MQASSADLFFRSAVRNQWPRLKAADLQNRSALPFFIAPPRGGRATAANTTEKNWKYHVPVFPQVFPDERPAGFRSQGDAGAKRKSRRNSTFPL